MYMYSINVVGILGASECWTTVCPFFFLKVALSEADSRCHELENKNAVLEGQVSDLQERVQLQSGADEQIMTLVTSKASQWEVRNID